MAQHWRRRMTKSSSSLLAALGAGAGGSRCLRSLEVGIDPSSFLDLGLEQLRTNVTVFVKGST
jgi:hypothetical protein